MNETSGYLQEEIDSTSTMNRSMTGFSNPDIVMTQNDFVAMLYTAQKVPNYYSNSRNLGQYDGQKYSFDCWNLIKTILSGWSPYPNYNPGGTSVTGDVTGATLLSKCGVTYGQRQDFSLIHEPGTYLYMEGHSGVYVGDFYDEQGRHYNVIECTHWSSSRSDDPRGYGDLYTSGNVTPVNTNPDGSAKGVIFTYISSTGQRRAYEGGRIGGQWSNYALLKWVEYSGNYSIPQVTEYTGNTAGYSGPGYPSTPGTPVYEARPTQAFEYMLRDAIMLPRTVPPVLQSSSRIIYEDGRESAEELVTINNGGVITTSTIYKRVKYDGRDMWYVPQSEGGWSPFDHLDNAAYAWCRFSEAMDPDPNNMLIGHVPCQLSRGMAVDMYRHEEDGYKRNVACALGAAMCFRSKKKLGSGYVCIVEEMHEDGVILTSEWNDSRFMTVRRQKRYGSWDFGDYVFQGFIHNPACQMNAEAESALDTFCRIAIESVGKSISWIQEQTQISSNNSCAAGLIIAVSKKAGSTLNIIIPNSISVTGIGRVGILQNMGTWVNGPANNSPGRPQVGDIVIIRTRAYKKPSIYQGDIAGIVTEVGTNSFKSVQVEGTKIIERTMPTSLSRIAGYFRPNWERVDGTTDSVKLYRNLHGLYTDGVTVEDACAREVGYLRNNLPSIRRTDIRLSAVNYTGLLSNMYTVFATSSTSDAADTDLIVDLWTTTIKSWFQDGGVRITTSSSSVSSNYESNDLSAEFKGVNNMLMQNYTVQDITQVTGIKPSGCNVGQNARTAFNYLTTYAGLSQAAAVGVISNLQGESGFNAAAEGDLGPYCNNCKTWNNSHGNSARGAVPACYKCGASMLSCIPVYSSFGICQWHNGKPGQGRGANMKAFVGDNWKSNLTGQLDYLLSELRGSYKGVYDAILAVPNTLPGAMYATDIFVRRFEVPADPDKASAGRQAHAMTFWSSLVQ